MHRLLRPALYGVALVVAASCGGDANSPTEPTAPDPSVIVNFSGTLMVNGAETHPFSVARAGGVSVILTDVTPDGVIVGLTLGTWNGSTCIAVFSSDRADEGERILGAASSAGNLCVRVHDTVGLTEAITYTIQVEHP